MTHNDVGLAIAKVDHFNLLIAKRASFLQLKSTNVVEGRSSDEMKNTSTTVSGKIICSISMWCYSGGFEYQYKQEAAFLEISLVFTVFWSHIDFLSDDGSSLTCRSS